MVTPIVRMAKTNNATLFGVMLTTEVVRTNATTPQEELYVPVMRGTTWTKLTQTRQFQSMLKLTQNHALVRYLIEFFLKKL